MADAVDAFTRADAATLGASWTNIVGSPKIYNNMATSTSTTGGVFEYAIYTAESFENDQYVEGVIVESPPNYQHTLGLLIRASLGAGNTLTGYFIYGDSSQAVNGTRLYRVTDGTFTQILPTYTGATFDGTIRITAVGDTISYYRNSTFRTSWTDNTHTSGRPGLITRDNYAITADTQRGAWSTWLGGPIAPSNAVKTVNGLTRSSIKTVNGLVLASVKSVNGLI